MQEAYRRSLDVVLRHRRATIFVSIAMTALTVCLFVVVPKSFMPAVDVPYFSGTLEASQDNSFDRMVAYGEQVNKILATIPWMQSNLSGVESQNFGWFWVNLVQDKHRPNVKVIIADLQKRLNQYSRPQCLSPPGRLRRASAKVKAARNTRPRLKAPTPRSCTDGRPA